MPNAASDTAHEEAPTGRRMTGRMTEIALSFLRLGATSFGGPVAHLGYLRAEFVERRKWLDDAQYGDIVALCQFLPGPASSQVVFALGMHRGGLAGALLASACFTLPSALLMIGFAFGVAQMHDLTNAGWLHGLKLAAVAVVAQAVWGMGKRLCPDRARIALCLACAAVLLAFPGAITQVAVIAAGALVGARLYRAATPLPKATTPPRTQEHVAAALALVAFAVLLVALPVLAAATGARSLAAFDRFYRAGALVFGGGHVVLPLLREELVPTGWLQDASFLAGYGAAQALPGPLFAFSAYLGTTMGADGPSFGFGMLCLLAIFSPAWLLIGGALPFWNALRAKRYVQASLAGANAAVVGVLLAALYSPVITEGVRDRYDVALSICAFGALEHWKAPPWLLVLVMAACGEWLLVH
jgi:chromate transporter